ncbi:DUF4192 family protein [Leucobacter denitrificans]|uniref:DUF4192 family protein n=1 Tax=Leucobacter denitrificans TaxID=683042 RepID=A0A7G9S6S5_9MICO|nr:DUF4192 family protein [Leucobacter denitrificans]QNN63550.1 DUF4192 family protein [Leucobacter denitrificans]
MTSTSRTTPEVLRCTNTADFLAALPRLVGFTAPHSLFVVLFSGRRSSASIRLDLPDSEDAQEISTYLDAVVEVLRRNFPPETLESPALVISSEMSFAEARNIPWRTLARGLRRRLTREGMPPREVCGIAPDGWVSYLDPSAPRTGRPLNEIAASQVASDKPQPTLASIGQYGSPLPEMCASVEQELLQAPPTTSHKERAQVAKEFAAAVHSHAAAEIPSARIMAGFIRVSQFPDCWDVILTHFLDQEAERASELPESRMQQRKCAELIATIAAHAPEDLKPNVFALCAVVWSYVGLHSVAQRQLDLAAQLDPECFGVRIATPFVESPYFLPNEAT